MLHFSNRVVMDSHEEKRKRRLEECAKVLTGYPELIKRQFIRSSDGHQKPEETATTTTSKAASPVPAPLRVMQYNILADALAYGPPDNFTSVQSACLLWNTRKERIVEQILSHNPDIICLQEVDHYEDFFLPLFNDLGYQGFFFPKKESPCLKMEGNNGPDGVSLFYRDARLDIVDVNMRYLRNADKKECSQSVVTCMLFDKVHLKNICVAVTHLKARQGFEGLRATQAKDLLQAVDDIRRKIDNKSAVAICGDFNGQPTEECYSVMENHPDLRLESAYKNLMKSEIPYTTWKIRDVEKKKTIDYIWINPDKVGVAACLAAPSEEDVPKERFPSFSCPSDHIALCCDFTLL